MVFSGAEEKQYNCYGGANQQPDAVMIRPEQKENTRHTCGGRYGDQAVQFMDRKRFFQSSADNCCRNEQQRIHEIRAKRRGCGKNYVANQQTHHQADSIRAIGLLYLNLGDLTQARFCYLNALEIYEELGDLRGQSYTQQLREGCRLRKIENCHQKRRGQGPRQKDRVDRWNWQEIFSKWYAIDWISFSSGLAMCDKIGNIVSA